MLLSNFIKDNLIHKNKKYAEINKFWKFKLNIYKTSNNIFNQVIYIYSVFFFK